MPHNTSKSVCISFASGICCFAFALGRDGCALVRVLPALISDGSALG